MFWDDVATWHRNICPHNRTEHWPLLSFCIMKAPNGTMSTETYMERSRHNCDQGPGGRWQAGAGMGKCLANMSTSGGTLNVSFHRVVQVVHIDNEDSVFELLSHSRENGKPFAFWLKQCVSNCPCSPFWCIATMPLAA